MKKTFASLVAALLAATLLAFSAPAATAADPYTGTVATKAVAVAPTRVLVGKPVVVKFKVIDASTRTPKGKVVLKAFNKNGKLVKRVSYAYDPDRRKYSVGELSKGNYSIISKFVPKADSIFKGSRSVATTKVVSGL